MLKKIITNIGRKKKSEKDNIGYTFSIFMGRPFKWLMIIIITFMVILPYYWLFTSSVKYEQDCLATPPVIVPNKITLNNYRYIFEEREVMTGIINSFTVASMTTIICIIFGSLAAYSLAKGQIGKKLINIFAFWFLIQKMYPAISIAIPIYIVMRKLALIDTKLSLIIMNISFNLPFVIWLMMGFFEDIPKGLEDSGKIDGANMWQRFYYLILPLTKPGIVASAILTFVAAWNEFLFAIILSIRRAKTLPVMIAGFITDRSLEWGPMSDMGITIIVPVVIIVWILQKDFVKGLTMGAVKE